MGDHSPAAALYNLRWDAQQSALLGSISTLFKEEVFVDTTIVSDGQIFKAHRLVLSASSPFLKNVLQVRWQSTSGILLFKCKKSI